MYGYELGWCWVVRLWCVMKVELPADHADYEGSGGGDEVAPREDISIGEMGKTEPKAARGVAEMEGKMNRE